MYFTSVTGLDTSASTFRAEKVRQHVQRCIFIKLWCFHLLVIGHLKHIGLAIWSPETHMSSGGFSVLLFKDQKINFMERKRSNNCHFCASACQKCLKYYGISGLLCHLPRPTRNFLLLESPFHHLAIEWTFFTMLEMKCSFRLSKWPVLPWFYFSCRSTVYSVYILCDLASLWIEMMEKMNHCLKQIRCQT